MSVITWQACPHILYTSDDEDQSGWQWLSVECPDCGCIGVNVEDGELQSALIQNESPPIKVESVPFEHDSVQLACSQGNPPDLDRPPVDLRHQIVTALRQCELQQSADYPTYFDLADAVIEAISSWDSLMELLDKHYPADVFPTLPDDARRDPGPRIVSLIRHLDAARAP